MGLPRALHHHHHAASTSASFGDVTHHTASRLLAAEHSLTANRYPHRFNLIKQNNIPKILKPYYYFFRLLPDPVHILLDHHSHTHHHHHHHHQSMSHHRLLASPAVPASTTAGSASTVDIVDVSSSQEVNVNPVSSTSSVIGALGGVSPPRGVFSNYHASGAVGFQSQNVVGVGVNGGAAFHPYSAGGYY